MELSITVRRACLATVLVLLPTLVAGCTTSQEASLEDASLETTARRAAAWIDTPGEARAAGYAPSAFCVPGEGVHWVDETAVDRHIDQLHPEIVLFYPTTGDVSDPDHQRFVGVEYVAVTEGTPHNDSETPPDVLGVPMQGPFPGASPGEPWHAVLHVLLVDGLSQHAPEPAPAGELPCPEGTLAPGTTPPASTDPRARGTPVDASQLDACRGLTGAEVHDHAEVFIHLEAADPVDLSPDRYQLAAAQVHVERGERDANGATVHVHEDGVTLACFLETLGWEVTETAIVTDAGEVYTENTTHRLEVTVGGEPAEEGLATELEHDTRYVIRYGDTTRGRGV